MKLAVIGTKEFTDYQKLSSILAAIKDINLIISGAAAGTDSLARRFARDNNISLQEFSPDYKKFGSEAKHVRDRQIVDHCHQLIAFWDGKCEGTEYTIKYARTKNIPVKIIPI